MEDYSMEKAIKKAVKFRPLLIHTTVQSFSQ